MAGRSYPNRAKRKIGRGLVGPRSARPGAPLGAYGNKMHKLNKKREELAAEEISF